MISLPPVKMKHGQRIIAKEIREEEASQTLQSTLDSTDTIDAEFEGLWTGSDISTSQIIARKKLQFVLSGQNDASIEMSGDCALYFIAEKNSQNQITITNIDNARQVIRVIAKPGSSTDFTFKGSSTTYVSYRQAKLYENSKVKWIGIPSVERARVIHHDQLIGDHSSSSQDLRYQSSSFSQLDASLSATHVGKHSLSELVAKATSVEGAQVILRGTITIEKSSRKSESHQELAILNFGGECDTIPQLNIENEEVICSHKASTTNLDEDKLFYLTQRGIEPSLAKRMIIRGFLS